MYKRYLLVLSIIQLATAMAFSEDMKRGTAAADSSDYYYQIPDYPEDYTNATVAARVVDGLGYRFYWASEGLREQDLEFVTVEGARSTAETIDHIFGLSLTILNSILAEPNVSVDYSHLTINEKRSQALNNIRKASELLKGAGGSDMDDYKIIFKSDKSTIEYPFWNMLNGPISDAIYHVGQIVVLRRASGNPINPGISMLQGKVRD